MSRSFGGGKGSRSFGGSRGSGSGGSRSFGGSGKGSRSFGGSSPGGAGRSGGAQSSDSSGGSVGGGGGDILSDFATSAFFMMLSALPIPFGIQVFILLLWIVASFIWGAGIAAIGGISIICIIACMYIFAPSRKDKVKHYSFVDEFTGIKKYDPDVLQSKDFREYIDWRLDKRGYLDKNGQILDDKIKNARNDFEDMYCLYLKEHPELSQAELRYMEAKYEKPVDPEGETAELKSEVPVNSEAETTVLTAVDPSYSEAETTVLTAEMPFDPGQEKSGSRL